MRKLLWREVVLGALGGIAVFSLLPTIVTGKLPGTDWADLL